MMNFERLTDMIRYEEKVENFGRFAVITPATSRRTRYALELLARIALLASSHKFIDIKRRVFTRTQSA